MNTLPTTTLKKYSGIVVRMSRERTNQSFAPGEHDQQVLGAIAVGAALVGAVGQATTLATVGSDPSEPADWVVGELDDGTKFHGWLWRSPFKIGDEVEIVATIGTEGKDQRHRLFAMARPRDRLIALYPHCSRGRYAHWKAFIGGGIKWGFWFSLFMSVLLFLARIIESDKANGTIFLEEAYDFPNMLLTSYIILGIPILALAWKWMAFVRVAEEVFTAFGWSNVKNIDLVARSKATPLDCKESNVREHDIGLTASSLTTSADYTAGFYRY